MCRKITTLLILLCLVSPLYAYKGKHKDREIEPFDRGIKSPNSLFIPKGTIIGGLTFSYSLYDLGHGANDAGFSFLSPVLKDIRGGYKSVSIAPNIKYCIKDNITVGVRFDYSKTGLDLENINLNIGDNFNFNFADCGYLRQSYLGSITARNYMPIENSKRFALFMEGRLTGGYAQSMDFKMDKGLKHGTYQNIYKAGISMVPGICVFIDNSVSFEVQIGVMGINWQMTDQITNRVERSRMHSSRANFNINLMSIGFGTNIYIMDKWHRKPKENGKRARRI